MQPSKDQQTPRDQYQHYIPRFILRKFRVDSGVRKSKKQRQWEYRQAKKNPSLSTENVQVYDLATGILESRPVGLAYGETNLYRDIRHLDNFNHIEEKLSRLESDAAVFVNNLHSALERGNSICVTRKELGMFRKFLYIMFYRPRHRPEVYCNEDHPYNVPLKEWLRKRKQDKGMVNDKDIGLDAIQYYLEHPHHILIVEGEQALKRIGGPTAVITAQNIDPTINWYALEYTNVANEYYMGIWEAAEGSEFVIGTNSFGLWEGLVVGGGVGIHRLYPLSPRLVIVLRMNIVRQFSGSDANDLGDDIKSALLDIPIEAAVPSYANYKGKGINPDGLVDDDWTIEKYRLSEAAQKDTYAIKIKQLDKGQTQLVNNVFLLNVNEGGSVSFASKGCMKDTIKEFSQTDGVRFGRMKRKYDGLLEELLSSNLNVNQ